jgi:hypothetical protein
MERLQVDKEAGKSRGIIENVNLTKQDWNLQEEGVFNLLYSIIFQLLSDLGRISAPILHLVKI